MAADPPGHRVCEGEPGLPARPAAPPLRGAGLAGDAGRDAVLDRGPAGRGAWALPGAPPDARGGGPAGVALMSPFQDRRGGVIGLAAAGRAGAETLSRLGAAVRLYDARREEPLPADTLASARALGDAV